MELCSITGLKGRVAVPGDKSISHRCIMFGSIADGITEVRNFLEGADCLATIRCFRSLGIEIEEKDASVIVHGKGLHGLSAPDSILDAGNSGTTTRLLSGILAGQPFESRLSGDESLNSRPMKRIIDPLTRMGAHISSIPGNGCAPLRITPSSLHGIHYDSPVASAQVKSCILLAGLYADGETSVNVPAKGISSLIIKDCPVKAGLQEKFADKGRKWKHSSFGSDFGNMSALLIDMGAELKTAYIFLRDDDSKYRKVSLEYRYDGGQWQSAEDVSYPYEFSLPVPADTKKMDFRISAADMAGNTVTGPDFTLSEK